MKTYRAWQMKPESMAVQMLNAYGLTVKGLNEEKNSVAVDLNDYELTYEMDFSGETGAGLKELYQVLNAPNRPTGEFAHSMCVGDLIEVEGIYYQVAPIGFKRVQMA